MKKFLKTAVVIAGLAIALVGSISKVSATENELEAPIEGCQCSGICGRTASGVTIYGTWSSNASSRCR